MAFSFFGGADSLGLLANADSAQAWFNTNNGIFDHDVTRAVPDISFIRLAPNPFNRGTRISYDMPTAGRLTIRVYDAGGRAVSRVFDQDVGAGRGVITWTPKGLTAGIYFLKAKLPAGTQTEKILLTK